MRFEKNLHIVDRTARAIVGVACFYVGFIDPVMIENDIVSVLVGLFGVVNLGAALFSHCPAYSLAGISTCRNED